MGMAKEKDKTKKAKAGKCVLVGAYRKQPDQLKWVGKRHLYNYPLSVEWSQAED